MAVLVAALSRAGQVLDDAASDALVLDDRDQPHRAGAPRADEHVHRVRPLHEDSPRQPSLAAGVVGDQDVISSRMNRKGDTPRMFYSAIAIAMLAIVTFGFSRTIGPSLLHAQRPGRDALLLGLHGVVFYGWMLLMVVQAALVRSRRIRVHKLLGWVGAADAALVVMMGLWATFHQPTPRPLEAIGVLSMAGFGIPVVLAVVWRKRPAYHRRLLLIGTAMLTNAAFARFPGSSLPSHYFYAGTDVLIAVGIAHDLWRDRSVHIVYRYAVPLLLGSEIAVLAPAWRYLG